MVYPICVLSLGMRFVAVLEHVRKYKYYRKDLDKTEIALLDYCSRAQDKDLLYFKSDFSCSVTKFSTTDISSIYTVSVSFSR